MTLALGPAIPLALPHEPAIERVTAALKEEGFGVLTRVDLHEAFQAKLGVTHRPHTILGACNPALAHRAITEEPLVGLLLPCNVTVEAAPGGGSLVRLVNPRAMLGMGELDPTGALGEVAADATARLERVAHRLTQG